MYDLNHSNSFIDNKGFKICDLDFYNSDNNESFVKLTNNYIVNKMFMEFIQEYIGNFRFSYANNVFYVADENYIDSVSRELKLKFGNCKTLSEMR